MQSPTLEEDDELSYFEESLQTIFDDVKVTHGNPGEYYTYHSRWKTITVCLAITETWEEQLKFSHFVWAAGLNIAKRIDSGDIPVAGKRVLELGAGAGLCGILASLAGAAETVLSDYPAESILANIRNNVLHNIERDELKDIHVQSHTWGESVASLVNRGSGGRFDVIMMGDCLWMPEQHAALCQTLHDTLRRTSEARIYCVAGFHSGRRNLAPFFRTARKVGLVPNGDLYELEHTGRTRSWEPERAEEDAVERKRWLVVAELEWSS